MWGIKRFYTTVCLIGLASLLFMGACGGSGFLGETDPTGESGESVPVRLTIDMGGDNTVLMNLAKDAGGSSQAGMDEGGVGSVDDDLSMQCLITFEAATAGTGITIASEDQDADDDVDVDDCIAMGGIASKCLICQNFWYLPDGSGGYIDDPTHSHCVGICEGQVPANVATAADAIPLDMHFYVDIVTDILSVGSAMIRQDGTVADFDEAIITNIEDDLLGVDFYVLDGCDGTDDMLMTLVDPILAVLGNPTIDANDGFSWTKGFSVDALDPTPSAEGSECAFETAIHADVPLTGAELGAVDLTRGPVVVNTMFCDDMLNCDAFGAGGVIPNESIVMYDAELNELDGATDVMISELNMDFPVVMSQSTMNSNNIVVYNDTLGEETTIDITLSPDDMNDEIYGDDYQATMTDAYLHQASELSFAATDLLSENNEMLESVLVANFTSAYSVSDAYRVDSNAAYALVDDLISNNPYPATTEIWAAGVEDVVTFDTPNEQIIVSDAAKVADALQTVNLHKAGLLAMDNWQFQVSIASFSGWDHFDDVGFGGADMLAWGIVDTTFTGYMIGVEAIYDDAITIPQQCFAVRFVMGAVTEGQYMDCSAASTLVLQLSYNTMTEQVVAEANLDGAGFVDIGQADHLYPEAGSIQLNLASMNEGINWHTFMIAKSAAGETTAGGAINNLATIDYVRWLGIDSNLGVFFSDIDYDVGDGGDGEPKK